MTDNCWLWPTEKSPKRCQQSAMLTLQTPSQVCVSSTAVASVSNKECPASRARSGVIGTCLCKSSNKQAAAKTVQHWART